MADDNPFHVLGLPPTARPEQVKAAYRRAARRVHPDAGGDEQAFTRLAQAAQRATAYATGAQPNPYLPDESHVAWDPHYDRHSHAPAPPPNVWRTGGLFWILPGAAAIFLLSAIAGPYFLPVFAASITLFGLVVWWVTARTRN